MAATRAAVLAPGRPEEEEVWDERALRRSRTRQVATTNAIRVLIIVVLLGSWQLASGRMIDPFWISDPASIGGRLAEWVSDGTLTRHLVSTLTAMLAGFAAGSTSGVVVGFTLGRAPRVAAVVDPFITAVYSLPKVALAPLFILWFGIGSLSKIALTTMIVFFLVFYNTYGGARSVDRELIDVAAVMGANRRQLLQKVVLPSSAAWIFIGLRLAVPYSLIGAVVGEILASNRGIGYLLRQSSGRFDTAGTFAALFVLMVLAIIINSGVKVLDKRTSRWHHLD